MCSWSISWYRGMVALRSGQEVEIIPETMPAPWTHGEESEAFVYVFEDMTAGLTSGGAHEWLAAKTI